MVAPARRLLGLGSASMLAAVVLAGCGSDESAVDATGNAAATPTSSATPSDAASSAAPAPAWPACGATWKRGATLPKPYHGCLDGGNAVPVVALRCSTGVQLVTFDDRFWGVPGHRIQAADGSIRHDREFASTRATCTA